MHQKIKQSNFLYGISLNVIVGNLFLFISRIYPREDEIVCFNCYETHDGDFGLTCRCEFKECVGIAETISESRECFSTSGVFVVLGALDLFPF